MTGLCRATADAGVFTRADPRAHTVVTHKEVDISPGGLHEVVSVSGLWESHPLSTDL